MIALAHITKYSNIFVRNLRIFEYIRTPTFQWSEYSNIFVFQFFYIRIRISNIRPGIFEYSNIFEYSLRSATSSTHSLLCSKQQFLSSNYFILTEKNGSLTDNTWKYLHEYQFGNLTHFTL